MRWKLQACIGQLDLLSHRFLCKLSHLHCPNMHYNITKAAVSTCTDILGDLVPFLLQNAVQRNV